MPTLRVFKGTLTGSTAPLVKLRVHKASLTGSAVIVPKLRVHKVSVAGAAGVSLQAIADQVADPLSTVTIAATLTPGSAAPDSYAFRQVSGPAVTLQGTGATRTFIAPSSMDTETVVIAVSATLGSYTTPERTGSTMVYPQTVWSRVHGGTGWVGAGVVVL